MDQYVIYLPTYPSSVAWANNAVESGNNHGWNLQLYEGVDGSITSLESHGTFASKINKKCFRYMQRPGTIGCFLSHYNLWKKCIIENKPITIFEHDVYFKNSPPTLPLSFDVIKYEGFNKAKPIPCGNWFEGARAYSISPEGAQRIVDWISVHGAMPADWMLCDGIVDLVFDHNKRVDYHQKTFSFTKDL